jgi:hypothetical protein
MEQIVKLPYGNGFCLLTVDYQPEEPEWFDHKEGVGNPCVPAEVTINEFLVGGVDIVDELMDLSVGYIQNGQTKYYGYLDDFVSVNWEEIVKQCREEDDV